MILWILWFIWVAFCCYCLMIVCDRYFVKSLDVISKKRNLSDDIAWATIMAVWTSAPEFFTSLMALVNGGKIWLWAGTIIWSAIFNILCIAWWSALFLNTVLKRWPFLRDSIFYGLFIALILVSFWDWGISWIEAISYMWLYAVYVLYLIYYNKKQQKLKADSSIQQVAEEIEEIEEEAESNIPWLKYIDQAISLSYPKDENLQAKYIYTFWASIVWIVFFSRLLVESGVAMASAFGIPEVIIWLTVLAAWTSVPDLLSSLIVAKKWRWDMAVANALGSNIFDIWICLWLPWIIYLAYTWSSSLPVKSDDLLFSIGTLFGVLIIVVWTFFITKFRINKTVWYIFIWVYALYLARAIWSSVS